MAARSIGSLTVSFGLVAIPVKLYTATQSQNAISFNMLHKDCGSRLKQQYICPKDGVDRRARRDGEGLRVRQGPVRARSRRKRSRRSRKRARTPSTSPSSCRSSPSIRCTSTRPTTSRPDKGAAKPYGLLTEAMKEAKLVRRRPLGRARQGVHRDAAAGRRRADDAAAALRRRRAPVHAKSKCRSRR